MIGYLYTQSNKGLVWGHQYVSNNRLIATRVTDARAHATR